MGRIAEHYQDAQQQQEQDEHQQWLADPAAQTEYQLWLDNRADGIGKPLADGLLLN